METEAEDEMGTGTVQDLTRHVQLAIRDFGYCSLQ